MKRPGYYVEEQWFKDRFHQARARAAYLASLYGRPIEMTQVNVEGKTEHVLTVYNTKAA